MFSRPSTFRLLITVIVLSCAGLVFLQVRLLQNTADLKRTSFDQNVMAALARTALGLEELDVVDRIFVTTDTLEWNTGQKTRQRVMTRPLFKTVNGNRGRAVDSTFQVSVMKTNAGTVRSWVRNGQLVTTVDRPQLVTVRMFDVAGRVDTMLVDRKALAGEHSLSLPRDRAAQGAYFIQVRTDEGVSTMRFDSAGSSSGYTFTTGDPSKREHVVRRVIESFDHPWNQPRVRAISLTSLDSLMGSALRHQSVDLPYEGALISADTVVVTAASRSWRPDAGDAYRLPVGLPGPFSVPETLAVRFPSRTAFVLTAMWPEISLSVMFLGVIVWLFSATVRTIVRQKEFSGRLSDFINNMTHEFKTPLATISLASEALRRPDVRKSGRKIDTYNAVIRDENKRMGSQVERILQMASLEEGDLDLRRDPVPMHDVIANAVAKAALQVAPLDGALTMQLTAKENVIRGDRVHLENVVHNLLDNAAKYSTAAPAVTIETENDEAYLRIVVRDRGIGIAEDQIERVFEKYYRVPTGNLHDVKGFGLGLSYVKLVVTSLGGTVRLKSTVGVGTEVEVRLPVSESNRNRKE